MTFKQKVSEARNCVREAVASSPDGLVLFSSFGKDSMVITHLAREYGVRQVAMIPNIDEVRDNDFIHRICKAWNLELRLLPIGRAMFMVVQGTPQFMSFVSLTPVDVTMAPTNLPLWEEGDPRQLVCVDDQLRATNGTVQNSLDIKALLCGFKRTDMLEARECQSLINMLPRERVEAYLENAGLNAVHTKITPTLEMHLPLLNWTDADVWQYIDEHHIPWSPRVYDYFARTKRPKSSAWCYRCHDPNQSTTVQCPKLGAPILNLSAATRDTDLKLEAFLRVQMLGAADAAALRGLT